MSVETDKLTEKRGSLLRQIEAVAPFRQGSLVENYRKCGKPTCHCAREGDPGHRQWLVTRSIGKKTISKLIRNPHLESTRQQIARFHLFQDLIHDYIETNIQICDKVMDSPEPEKVKPPEEAEKGGSKLP